MQKILSVTLMSFILASAAFASAVEGPVSKDGQIPWPWGTEMEFPWDDVQGQWLGKSKTGGMAIFSFEMVRTVSGSKFLRIKEVDIPTGQIMSLGTGVENAKIVTSLMSGPCYDSYRLSLRAYQVEREQGRPHDEATHTMALSVGPANSFSRWVHHYELTKIHSEPISGFCDSSCGRNSGSSSGF